VTEAKKENENVAKGKVREAEKPVEDKKDKK